MTCTVTVRARAVPVQVQQGGTTTTVQPWLSNDFHVDGQATFSITEAEPATDPEPEQSSDEVVAAAQATRDAEEAPDEQPRRGRKPSVD